MNDCRLVLEIKNDKIDVEYNNGNMVELAFLCGTLQQIMGLEAVKRGVKLDDVKDNMLDLHLNAMQALTEQVIKGKGG